mmetsp:Transcript_56436/g.121981  ORF Transcript_56436/g.121981 Transcript_56436/m.121981 type:complete len:209 (-) Transcript_56436:4258-4884(-)
MVSQHLIVPEPGHAVRQRHVRVLHQLKAARALHPTRTAGPGALAPFLPVAPAAPEFLTFACLPLNALLEQALLAAVGRFHLNRASSLSRVSHRLSFARATLAPLLPAAQFAIDWLSHGIFLAVVYERGHARKLEPTPGALSCAIVSVRLRAVDLEGDWEGGLPGEEQQDSSLTLINGAGSPSSWVLAVFNHSKEHWVFWVVAHAAQGR